MPRPEWIFLDVGNVLLDEDRLTCYLFHRHLDAARILHPHLDFGRLLAEYEGAALRGSRWPLYEAAVPYLGDAGMEEVWSTVDRDVRADYGWYCPMVRGAGWLLDQVGQVARLGVIANQPTQARKWLHELGWLDRFEVVALSEEEGVYKPDPALFRRALDRTGADPAACLMVGDRPENDLRPAAALGMATAWVRWPDRRAKGWDPAEPEQSAFIEALGRIAAARRHEAMPTPTIQADDLEGLVDAILDLGKFATTFADPGDP